MKMEDMSLSGLDNSKLEAIAHEIYTELVEDACLGLCFEVHRAVKCGYFFLDDTDPDSMKDFEIVDQPGVDIFGQVYNQWKNKECVCPNCSRSIAASRFAPHLEKCLGMGRNSSRIANRRIASSNNLNKSESDQEDNDDINDNDWSYGSEKKGGGSLVPSGVGDAGLGTGTPLGKLGGNGSIGLGLGCAVVGSWAELGASPSHCEGLYPPMPRAGDPLTPVPRSLPEAEAGVENDSFEVAESQALMSRLQWDGSSDISPSDSASSKASECTNNSESRKTKKKKPHLGLVSGAPGLGSSKKKKPKPPAPHTPSIYDDIN
ncbi:AT7L3 protein, partial [Tyrannus savana]|nr:AT7L3 protein [Tyrannus savana]